MYYSSDTLRDMAKNAWQCNVGIDPTKELIKQGDINYQDGENNTLLHYACMYRSIPIVKLLLQNDANLTITNRYGKTPREVIMHGDHVIPNLIKHALQKNKLQRVLNTLHRDISVIQTCVITDTYSNASCKLLDNIWQTFDGLKDELKKYQLK